MNAAVAQDTVTVLHPDSPAPLNRVLGMLETAKAEARQMSYSLADRMDALAKECDDLAGAAGQVMTPGVRETVNRSAGVLQVRAKELRVLLERVPG